HEARDAAAHRGDLRPRHSRLNRAAVSGSVALALRFPPGPKTPLKMIERGGERADLIAQGESRRAFAKPGSRTRIESRGDDSPYRGKVRIIAGEIGEKRDAGRFGLAAGNSSQSSVPRVELPLIVAGPVE